MKTWADQSNGSGPAHLPASRVFQLQREPVRRLRARAALNVRSQVVVCVCASQKDEETAQGCDIAWLRQPSFYNPQAMRSRIMYIESKAEGLNGPARIGRSLSTGLDARSPTKADRSEASRAAASKRTTTTLKAARSIGFRVHVVMDWAVCTTRVR